MSKVVPLFVKDEFTGLMVPNTKSDPVWILLDKWGRAVACAESQNEAIQYMSVDDDIVGYVKA